MTEDFTGRVDTWLSARRQALVGSGMTVEVTRSSDAHAKRSVAVYFELHERGGFVTVWDTGECQVSTVDYGSAQEPVEEHHRPAMAHEVDRILARVLSWVANGVSGEV